MSLVSVIIPAYNQAQFLGEAINSVLNQTYNNFEIIVVDDGSTDQTRDITSSYSDPRIHYIYQVNRGLSSARNTGIRSSKGSYLSFLDSDDLFLPEKLSLMVSDFERNEDVGFLAGQAIPIDEHGNKIGKIFDKPISRDPKQLLLGNPLHVGSVMLRRSWQEKVGYFDESLRSYEDWDMWIRLARAGCPMGWVDKPVSQYRFHTSQMTRIGHQMTTATFTVLEKTFNDPELPQSWRAMHDEAYSNAYLRASAQAYHTSNLVQAKEFLSSAVTLNPELLVDNARSLRQQFSAWMDLPKTEDPLTLLETIYNNLPPQIPITSRLRHQELTRGAKRIVYEGYKNTNHLNTLKSFWRAVRYQPTWLFKRGTISILIHSMITAFHQRMNNSNQRSSVAPSRR